MIILRGLFIIAGAVTVLGLVVFGLLQLLNAFFVLTSGAVDHDPGCQRRKPQ